MQRLTSSVCGLSRFLSATKGCMNFPVATGWGQQGFSKKVVLLGLLVAVVLELCTDASLGLVCSGLPEVWQKHPAVINCSATGFARIVNRIEFCY